MLKWKTLLIHVGQEGSIADIIGSLNMLEVLNHTKSWLTPFEVGFASWKLLFYKDESSTSTYKEDQNWRNFTVFAFMEKFGIISMNTALAGCHGPSNNIAHFLKWALVSGVKGEIILRYFLARIRYDPKNYVENGILTKRYYFPELPNQ